MTNIELLKSILNQIKRLKWMILAIALLLGSVFYFIASRSIRIYTSRATIFPLNNASVSDVGVSNSIINVLGITDAPKSFTGDASISILELASSRNITEKIASSYANLMPSLHNKQIAELLIEENNKHAGFLKNSFIDTSKMSDYDKILVASEMLINNSSVKFNKNGLLELSFANSNPDLVREVSYIFMDDFSKFYIDLKKKKAQLDYDFAVMKVDSLQRVSREIDSMDIHLDETTFFTKDQLKRYTIPKSNLETKKSTVLSQYYYAINNREISAYRLQKETPILQALDKPDPPYSSIQKSKSKYAMMGCILGLIFGSLIAAVPSIIKYLKFELKKMEKKPVDQNLEEEIIA